MPTIEIPRETWIQRLNAFTAVHAGWLISVEVLGELGAQTEITDLPLLDLSIDHVGEHETAVVVSAGPSLREHVTHRIDAVSQIFLQQTEDGSDAALEVVSADGTKTIVRFRVAALPDTVDGIVSPY